MGWFDEQISQRKENEEAVLSEAICNIVGAVSGEKVFFNINDKRKTLVNSIDEILKFYHLKSRDLPDAINGTEDQLEYLLRPHGIMRRRVVLKKGWHKEAIAPMLATRKDNGSAVALIPYKSSGYVFNDVESGKQCKVTQQNEEIFENEAICFYKPFPKDCISKKDLAGYILKTIPKTDFVYFAFISFVAVLIGLIVPAIYKLLLETVVYQSNIEPLLAASVFLISVTIGAGIFSAVKRLMVAKIKNEMKLSVEAAIMMRILSLPASFFKKHSSGDLSNRVQSVETVCETLADSVINSGVTALFSLMFILQIYIFAPSLFDISICIMISHMVFSVICGILQTKVKRKQVEYSDKEQGISYALISGIQKIKLAGAEKRAFSKWANAYAKTASAMYNPPFILKAKNAVSAAIALVGGICIYYVAAKNNVGVADYYAFNSAYAIASVAFFSFIEITVAFAEIKSKIEDINLFFESEPEISSEKQVLTKISGGIELCNVSFRYANEMPDVIDNISLKISPGQYVAIVGKTGCGKSTLMRLMLGLEKARKGVIYYDNKDIEKIDLKSLRQKIGVVMQDGKLFRGDILSNITIASPNIPAEKVWEAAEIAGIADDIKKMPMGIKTIVSEGSRGISGGQKQRILIARAIVTNPKILMLDEATSALDNVTQKKIADSLEGLNCTRIVIAHRLSTIKQCNRIIVLDKGKIAEDGTYDELMQKNGLFAELVSRQKIE
jgi:NHLM bacteriocin system ABC transporter ATP-binding protein